MADNDQKIEVEFSLKDDMSPILRAIEDALRSVNSTLAKTGTAEGGGISKLTQSTRELGEEAKRASGFLDNMGGFMSGVARTLGGPGLTVGTVAYGVAKVVEQMDKFALASVNMKNFAHDTGFTVQQIENIQLQYQRAGEPISAANQQIQKFAGMFDEIVKKETTAPFFQELYRYNQTLAVNFLDLVKAGERWKALQLLRDAAIKAAADGQTLLAHRLNEMAGVQSNTWTILNDNLEGAAKLWRVPEDKLKAVDERISEWVQTSAKWKDMFANFKMDLEMRRLFATIQDPEERRKAYDSLRKQEGTVHRDLPGDPFPSQLWGDIYSMRPRFLGGSTAEDLLKKKEDSKSTAQDISDILQRINPPYPLYGQPIPRQEGGPVDSGREYLVGEKHAELFEPDSGKFQLVGERGPEVIKPSRSGRILTGVERPESYEPPDPRDVLTQRILGKFLTPVGGAAADILKEANPELRTWLRKNTPEGVKNFLGIKPFADDPNEPAPWQEGGEWNKNKMFADAGNQFGAGGSEELTSQAEYMNVRSKQLQEELDNPAVQNWTAMNQQLKLLANEGRWGQAEGEVAGPSGPSAGAGPSGRNLFGKPIIEDLRKEGQRMEERQLGIIEDVGTAMMRERGIIYPFPDRGGQPISLDREKLDRRLGEESNNNGAPKVNGSMIFDNVPPDVTVETDFKGFDQSTKRVNKQRPELAI